ncbi:transposase [Metabacillus rhizolycopersici]|uniref:Transposase n=1 Tax=Metabacillus rhizolycopersici TaxID=2875709 RepID=A0ABS7ULH3_9BACI|nr:transposase [Metabacillus rhizolycopersici]MBZ5748889.1 transposase [Metabacillus rhizolycopersici]
MITADQNNSAVEAVEVKDNRILKKNEHHLTFLFLPPYSPNLNTVERIILGWLKGSVIVNRFHATRQEIRKSVFSFMEYLDTCPEKVLQRIGLLAMSKN